MRRTRVYYSDAVATAICAEMARGRRLKDICRDDGMPHPETVFKWARENVHGFGERYRSRPHPRGVALLYSRVLTDRICAELRTGRTLQDICGRRDMPSPTTVTTWAKQDRDGFRTRFQEARDIGYLAIADEIIAIADDTRTDVARARVKIDARCWLLTKMLPRLFGHRVSLDVTHEAGDSLREVLDAIDGRTRGLPAQSSDKNSGKDAEKDADAVTDDDAAREHCPCCGAILRDR